MPVDKTWLINPNRSSPEYQQGLESFIERCNNHVDNRGYVRCACAKCENSKIIPLRIMKGHMRAFGICRTYNRWIYHGESLVPPVGVVDDVAPTNDIAGVIEDVMDERMEEDTNDDEGNSGTESSGGIEAAIIKRYRGRKTNAKTHFTKMGGANDVEETKKRPPPDMESENWKKAVDYFCSESHKNRSAVNIENRKLQKYTNHGGTATYSSYGYKKKSTPPSFVDDHGDEDNRDENQLLESPWRRTRNESHRLEFFVSDGGAVT